MFGQVSEDQTGEPQQEPADAEQEASDPKQSYWATWKGRDFVDAINDKEDTFFEAARARGVLGLWIISYAAHHGLTPEDLRDFATQQIGFQGNELELLRFHINVVRGYIRQQTTLSLGDRPEFRAAVANDDHQSLARSEIADGIINALYKRYVANTDPKVAESDGVFGSGATHFRWNFTGGDLVLTPETVDGPDGQPTETKTKKRSGAPVVTCLRPWSLPQEVRDAGEALWFIAREPQNKWELIAQFPTKKDQILNVSDENDKWDFGQLFRIDSFGEKNRDAITVKHCYHAPCAAVPNGRYCIVFGDCIVWDGDCPTKEKTPISVCRSGEFIETTFGYADAWDMLAIQQALNQVNSDELQNYSLFGRQSIAMETGTKVSVDALAKGTAFYVPPKAAMPQAVQLVAIPPTLQALKEYLHKMFDLLSGQNAGSRGDPDPNVRSGEMLALLDSQALRYQSFRQEAVRSHRIRNAEILLNFVDRYSTTPFIAEIVGVEGRTFVAEYTKDDLSDVQRVTIETISPAMQSAPMRLQLFQQLMTLPQEERAGAYEMVVNGNKTQFLKNDRSQQNYIKRENERMITGEMDVFPLDTDDIFMHYPEHDACMKRILASDNPDMEAVDRFQKHMFDHVQVYLSSEPLVCGVMGINPPPTIQPTPNNPEGNAAFRFMMQTGGAGAPPPGGPAAPGKPGAPPPGGPAPKDPSNGNQPAGGAAQRGEAGGAPRQLHPSGTPLPQPAQPPQ